MISIETLKQYPFFAALNNEQLNILVSVSQKKTAEAGQLICNIGERLDHFFLIVEGTMEVIFDLPHIKVTYESTGQPSQLQKEKVILGQIGIGDICGWSGLVPPYISTSSVRALSSCTIISFDSQKIIKAFEDDCRFGFIMIQTAAQAIGKRLEIIHRHTYS